MARSTIPYQIEVDHNSTHSTKCLYFCIHFQCKSQWLLLNTKRTERSSHPAFSEAHIICMHLQNALSSSYITYQLASQIITIEKAANFTSWFFYDSSPCLSPTNEFTFYVHFLLQIRKSTAKLELYRKFTNSLAVSVLLSVAWIGYEVWFCWYMTNQQYLILNKSFLIHNQIIEGSSVRW